MPEPLQTVLYGIGGYGRFYVRFALDRKQHAIELAGAIDPAARQCATGATLVEKHIPIFSSAGHCCAHHPVDLAIIATPPHLHALHITEALAQGCNVLCEKPLCTVVDDAVTIANARDRADKLVAIGYQWAYSPAIQRLKRDVAAGLFGRPLRMRSLVFWPRTVHYYRRNPWAGRLRDDAGRIVLDSPVMNGGAHFLHAMFFVLGDTPADSKNPVDICAELYRAFDIESFDTAALRAHTGEGVEVLFYVSHCVAAEAGPKFTFEFENAVVSCDGPGREIVAHFHDNSVAAYGKIDHHSPGKLLDTVDAIRTGGDATCTVEAALCQTLCANGCHESVPDIIDVPPRLVKERERDGVRWRWIDGIDTLLTECFSRGRLPSELGARWASSGKLIDVRNYRRFSARV
ncbi:MAG: gfo/Idh/MocA family oxidoreductase [Chitinivibrionales bacterium]|nr:gfo/Idh/MocA family oxidoreductase [Chitinivibrionales bacterium]